ncbi:hypothetical protein KQX54_003415 [Cotesia glomerata]|uniref:Uncharacterized protein n=1 Tax=Cotesia glomerata TaxID=32391 RepID=A0AAV7ILT7_COTGL|nr:hypothetical protein KQX54_003415 [Cotesia glomerata]
MPKWFASLSPLNLISEALCRFDSVHLIIHEEMNDSGESSLSGHVPIECLPCEWRRQARMVIDCLVEDRRILYLWTLDCGL